MTANSLVVGVLCTDSPSYRTVQYFHQEGHTPYLEKAIAPHYVNKLAWHSHREINWMKHLPLPWFSSSISELMDNIEWGWKRMQAKHNTCAVCHSWSTCSFVFKQLPGSIYIVPGWMSSFRCELLHVSTVFICFVVHEQYKSSVFIPFVVHVPYESSHACKHHVCSLWWSFKNYYEHKIYSKGYKMLLVLHVSWLWCKLPEMHVKKKYMCDDANSNRTTPNGSAASVWR